MNKILLPLIAIIFFTAIFSRVYSQYTYHCGGSLLHFHGTNGYVDAEDPLENNMGITLAAWVRCEVPHPSKMGLIYRKYFVYQGGSTTVEWGLVINSKGQFMFQGVVDTTKGLGIEYSTPGQLDSLSSGIVPDSGKFYHVAVTLDPNTFLCNFYINGVIVASKTMKGQLHWASDGQGNEYDATIGVSSMTYQGNFYVPYSFTYFNGYMDDVFMSGTPINKSQLDSLASGINLNASVFFYPFSEGSGTQTYSNPGTVFNTNNYGNTGYINGDAAWVTNVACPLKVSIIDPDPSMILENGSLSNDPSRINSNHVMLGASTDGITKLLLVADATVPITFSLSSPSDGSIYSLDNQRPNIVPISITPQNGKVVCVYQVPDGYGVNNPIGREVTVQAYYSSDNSHQTNINIKLVTPPVILVHGMWGNRSDWSKSDFLGNLQKDLNYSATTSKNLPQSIYLADYSEGGANGTFDPAQPESHYAEGCIANQVIAALHTYRENMFAATQADMVAVDLGGLVARNYSQDTPKFIKSENYNKGYIHKLITMGTPHRGTPMGPTLWNHRNDLCLFTYGKDLAAIVYEVLNTELKLPAALIRSPKEILKEIYDLYGFINDAKDILAGPSTVGQLLARDHKPIGTCHRDFAFNSNAYNNLTGGSEFYAFSITAFNSGSSSPNFSELFNEGNAYSDENVFWAWVTSNDRTIKTFDSVFENPLICTNVKTPSTDLSVEQNSQTGGISQTKKFSGTAAVKSFQDTTYLTSSQVTSFVDTLLLTNNTNLFHRGFPSPSTIQSDCTNGTYRISHANRTDSLLPFNKNRVLSDSVAEVLITAPVKGSVYQIGNSKLHLQYSVTGPITPTISFMDIVDVGRYVIPKVAPYDTIVTLPQNISVGNHLIILFVKDTTGLLFADTCTIFIKPKGVLDSINVNPGSVRLDSSGRITSLNSQGYYSDGSISDISSSSAGTSYAPQKGNKIFSVNTEGVLTGIKPGTDTLIISNSGLTVRVPVTVDSNFVSRAMYPNIIDFPAIGDIVYGNVPFALSASSSSGDDVNFSLISGPAVVQNGALIITGVGSVTVMASDSGNSYFSKAADATITFNVLKADQIISFDSIPNLNHADTTIFVNAKSNTPLPIVYELVSGPGNLMGDTLTITGKGTIIIRAVQYGNEDYNTDSVQTQFTIEGALPLTLLNFTASLSNKQVSLNWQTAQEINTAYFTLERSTNGNDFSAIGKVNAAGNSSTKKDYSYIDQNPLIGRNYYRLQMVDADGKFTYSKIVVIEVSKGSNSFKIFPNPTKGLVNITGKNLQIVKIYDVSGRLQLNQRVVNQNTLSLNISNLSKGIYLVELADSEGNKETEKLIVY